MLCDMTAANACKFFFPPPPLYHEGKKKIILIWLDIPVVKVPKAFWTLSQGTLFATLALYPPLAWELTAGSFQIPAQELEFGKQAWSILLGVF